MKHFTSYMKLLLASLLMVVGVQNSMAQSYQKVTSVGDVTDGQYLIVYEDGNVAFNAGLETLDAAGNTIEVTIGNDAIAATTAIDNASFTITKTETTSAFCVTIQSQDGKYVGQTSDANGLQSSDNAIENVCSFNDDGSVNFQSGGAYLRYNSAANQLRFRYYKSASYTNQKAIQLYKRVDGGGGDTPTVTVPKPVIKPGTGTYYAAREVTITCTDADAEIYYSIGSSEVQQYVSPFWVSETSTITAFALKGNYNSGDVEATLTFVQPELLMSNEDAITKATSDKVVYAFNSNGQDVQFVNGKNCFVKDYTGRGLLLFNPSANFEGIAVGDRLSAGGAIGDLYLYNGQTEFVMKDGYDFFTRIPGQTSTITPIEVTEQALKADLIPDAVAQQTKNYENLLVKVTGVTLTAATFTSKNVTTAGGLTLRDQFNLFTNFELSTEKTYTVTGIAVCYNKNTTYTPQIYITEMVEEGGSQPEPEYATFSFTMAGVDIDAEATQVTVTAGDVDFGVKVQTNYGTGTDYNPYEHIWYYKDNDGPYQYNPESPTINITQTTAVKFVLKDATDENEIDSRTITFVVEGNDPQPGQLTGAGTVESPYTVADALTIINGLDANGSTEAVYVQGVITSITEVNTTYHNATYVISGVDGAPATLTVFRGKNLGNTDFTAEGQINVNDNVIVYGKLKRYVKDDVETPEIDKDNYIYSLNGVTGTPVEPEPDPTFDGVAAISWTADTDWTEIDGGRSFVNDAGYQVTAKNTGGGTKPTVNANAKDFRSYAGNTVQFYNPNKTMKKMTFVISNQGKKRLTDITADKGSVEITAGEATTWTVVWTGETSCVTFTVGDKATYGTDGAEKAGQFDFDSPVYIVASDGGNGDQPGEEPVVLPKPTISGTTPFDESTVVTITVEGDGYGIKYKKAEGAEYDVYTEPFTITETTTIWAVSYLPTGEESAVAQKTFTKKDPVVVGDNDVLFDFNKNEWQLPVNTQEDANAGEIKAPITQGGVTLTTTNGSTPTRMWTTNNVSQLRAYKGATLTFEAPQGKHFEKAVFAVNAANFTVNAAEVTFDSDKKSATWTGSSNKVVLDLTGTVQFNQVILTLANGEGTDNYEPQTPEEPTVETEHQGTVDDPYSVSDALAIINALEAGKTTADAVYVSGEVMGITEFSAQYGNITYVIAENAAATVGITVFRGKGLKNQNFTSEDELKQGDKVVIYGKLQRYVDKDQVETAEITNSYIYSLNGQTEPEEKEVPVYDGLANAIAGATDARVTSVINLREALVTYVNGASLYIESEGYGMLVYGFGEAAQKGDKVSGSIKGQLYLYNGLPEIAFDSNDTESKCDFTVVSSNNVVTPADVEISDLDRDYLSRYVALEGVNFLATAWESRNVTITQNGEEIILRDNWKLFENETFLLDQEYNVEGFLSVYNGVYQLYPIAIELNSNLLDPESAWAESKIVITSMDDKVENQFTTKSDGAVTYKSSDETVATIDEQGNITIVGDGTTTITATTATTDTYLSSWASFTLVVSTKGEPDGTEVNPYTIELVQEIYESESKPADPVWIEGYIVGYVDGTSYNGPANAAPARRVAVFGIPDESQTEILIAASPEETNPDNCIPVQLPKGILREQLDLYAHPELLGQSIKVCGTVDKYFGTCGIKNTTDAIINGESIVDAIMAVRAAEMLEGVYTISGQKVSEITRGGLYIINGKKVFVK